jgi:hypothetical protein
MEFTIAWLCNKVPSFSFGEARPDELRSDWDKRMRPYDAQL